MSKCLKNDCLCLQINFYFANTHGRRKNSKANMDGRPEFQLFLPEKKNKTKKKTKKKQQKTEFAIMFRYEIDISFKRTKIGNPRRPFSGTQVSNTGPSVPLVTLTTTRYDIFIHIFI